VYEFRGMQYKAVVVCVPEEKYEENRTRNRIRLKPDASSRV